MLRKLYIFLFAFYLISIHKVYCNTFGSATLIPTVNSFNSVPYPCYNSNLNQFLITWTDTSTYIYYMIYDTNGTIVVNTQMLGELSSGSSSNIFSVFNSHTNQYFLIWIDNSGYIYFAILDNTGNIVTIQSTSYAINPGNSSVNIIWNSLTYQYFIYWVDITDNILYCSTLDEDGTPVSSPQIISSSANYGNFLGAFNQDRNEYLIPWTEPSGNVHYDIYDALGNQLFASSLILPSFYNTVSCAYNTQTHQYFILWADQSYQLNFLIIDGEGNTITGPSLLDFYSGSIGTPTVCVSYNSINNQFVITSIYESSSPARLGMLICDAQGTQITPVFYIPNYTAAGDLSAFPTIFNAYSQETNSFFLTWICRIDESPDYQNGVFNTYFVTYPPSIPLNFSGTRVLNRFANYGEYVNKLTWSLSSSLGVSYYNLYRNNIFLTRLPANQTEYQQHNQPNEITTYTLTTVNSDGEESFPASTRF